MEELSTAVTTKALMALFIGPLLTLIFPILYAFAAVTEMFIADFHDEFANHSIFYMIFTFVGMFLFFLVCSAAVTLAGAYIGALILAVPTLLILNVINQLNYVLYMFITLSIFSLLILPSYDDEGLFTLLFYIPAILCLTGCYRMFLD